MESYDERLVERRVRSILLHLHPHHSQNFISSVDTDYRLLNGGIASTQVSGSQPLKNEDVSNRKEKEGVGESKAAGKRPVILVVGAGDATGGAIAKRFAKEGYVACIVRRNADKLEPLAQEIMREGGVAYAYGIDARIEEQVVALVEKIEQEVGEITVLVFNIGANVNFSILETTARVYRKVWEMACFAGFLTGREVAKRMVDREKGTIIFTGATASVRGGSGFAAFSGGKFGLRALAQSMGRELGPKGIHVAHVIIDAAIDTTWTRGRVTDPALLSEREGFVSPKDVAETYWHIHQQPRTAWSHEMDLRPWIEAW